MASSDFQSSTSSVRSSGYPVFTNNLWRILNAKENSSIISYTDETSNRFAIKNLQRFSHYILPRYYKMHHVQQYYDHLERYGFKRISDEPQTWFHPKWDRTNKESLNNIPKIHRSKKTPSNPLLRSNVSLSALARKLEQETRAREALEREVSELKKTVYCLANIIGLNEMKTAQNNIFTSEPKSRKRRHLESSASDPREIAKKRLILKEIPSTSIASKTSLPGGILVSPSPKQRETLSPATSNSVTSPMNVHQGAKREPRSIREIPKPRSTRMESLNLSYENASLKTEVLQAQIKW